MSVASSAGAVVPRVSVVDRRPARRATALAAVPVPGRTDAPAAREALGAGGRRTLREAGFEGRPGEIAIVPADREVPSRRLAFGIGAPSSDDGLRAGALAVGEALCRLSAVSIDLSALDPERAPSAAAAFVEGVVIGSRACAALEPEGARTPGAVEVTVAVVPDAATRAREACRSAEARAAAANLARAWTDLAPAELTPRRFAEIADELGERHGWAVATLGPDALAAGGFGGLLAVGAGSARPPYLIDVTYRGAGSAEPAVCLIGKGVTFDAGGLTFKTNRPVTARMKADMAAGAAALACLAAVSELALPLDVRVLVPAAENMPGPGAVRPGDVITHRGGRRTEVNNTDAEGRLMLADGLAYAREHGRGTALIDLGTLEQGSFGPGSWTAYTRDGALADSLGAASAAVGEAGVAARLLPGYEPWLHSPTADAKNHSFDHPAWDQMLAAVFLAPFAGDSRWAHLDVTDASYLLAPWNGWPAGATGAPTRSLVTLLERWKARS